MEQRHHVGDVAVTLLKMTGHSGTVPSAPRAGDIPSALARLKQELAAAGPEEESKQSVRSGCRRRALPGFRLVAVAGLRRRRHGAKLGVRGRQRVAAQSRQVVNLAQQQAIKALCAVAYRR